MATAYASLALWVVTLLLGPVRLLRSRPNPVSTDLRRDIGIWAALLGLGHVWLGLRSHLSGRWWLYFVSPDPGALPIMPRLDSFGFANYTGLLAALVLVLLLALSNDLSLRRLGTPRWKRLQQASYLGFGMTLLHGIVYQVVEQQAFGFVLSLVGLAGGAALLQALGIRARRRARERTVAGRPTPEPLLAGPVRTSGGPGKGG